MNKKIIILVIIIVVLIAAFILLAGYIKPYSSGTSNVGPAAEVAPHATENAVTIYNFSFLPGTLTVSQGTKVIWWHDDDITHKIAADDGSFTSGNMNRGDEFSHTFNTKGIFNYHCAIHPSMIGQIIVQ